MRIGFIADVHGHVEAMDIAFRLLEARGVERVCFLGDAVGYLPGTAAIVSIEAACAICLKGNHEAMLLDSKALPKDRDAIYRLGETRLLCDDPDLFARIECWPTKQHDIWSSGTALLVHGSPVEPLNGYLYPDSRLDDLGSEGPAYVVCAHTHRPFIRRTERTTWINCGSVGLPRDDGRFGSLALFDEGKGQAEILRFDIQDATARALHRVGTVAEVVLSVYRRRAQGQLEGNIVV